MKCIYTHCIVNARVKTNSKSRLMKCIKTQIFTIQNNQPHHLIGNIYNSILRNRLISIIEEKEICRIKPMILNKFTFRHEAKRKLTKPSLFNKQPYWLNIKDY